MNDRTNSPSPTRRFTTPVAAAAGLFLARAAAAAAPTQEDVFRSIQHNVSGGNGSGGGEVDGNVLLAVVFGLIVLVVIVSLVGKHRGARPATPKTRNHQGKLLREVLKSIPLKAKELKQLKVMTEHVDPAEPVASPLTLLLCPSVMAKTIQQGKRIKFDRRALASVARKAGLQVTKR